MATLGWIGLGDIGFPMAQRLLKSGHTLRVWGRQRSKLEPIVAAGAQVADSAAQLADGCDGIFLCVTDADAVEQVVFGREGIAQTARAPQLLIDHSSIHPQRSRQLAARLRQHSGMGWLDAPVSGGRVGAERGTLAVFVGGETTELQRAREWIRSYAARITHIGDSGAGQIAKTCNQAVVCATLSVWAEVLNYAARSEVDVAAVVDALEGSWSDSPIRKLHVPHMLSGDYASGSASLMLKDLDIVGDMARGSRSPMPLTAVVTSLFRQFISAGGDAAGPAGVMQVYHNGPLQPLKSKT